MRLLRHPPGGLINNVRYTPEEAIRCQADMVCESGKRHPTRPHPAPDQAPATGGSAVSDFLGKAFPIVNAARVEVGHVGDPRAFALRFEYGMHLPGASRHLLAFLLVATYLVRR